MSDADSLADWLGEQSYARNEWDHTDEATTVVRVDVETLAGDLLASGWLAEHDREVRLAALIEGADAILRRRALVGSSGSTKHDETWDNGSMAAEAIVRSLAERKPDDAAPGGAP